MLCKLPLRFLWYVLQLVHVVLLAEQKRGCANSPRLFWEFLSLLSGGDVAGVFPGFWLLVRVARKLSALVARSTPLILIPVELLVSPSKETLLFAARTPMCVNTMPRRKDADCDL